jgi:hypothetical protein
MRSFAFFYGKNEEIFLPQFRVAFFKGELKLSKLRKKSNQNCVPVMFKKHGGGSLFMLCHKYKKEMGTNSRQIGNGGKHVRPDRHLTRIYLNDYIKDYNNP